MSILYPLPNPELRDPHDIEYDACVLEPLRKAGCCFCVEKRTPVAMWMSHKDITICRECALYVLPRLLADAIVGPDGYNHFLTARASDGIAEFTATFWRAVAIAITSRYERNQKIALHQEMDKEEASRDPFAVEGK